MSNEPILFNECMRYPLESVPGKRVGLKCSSSYHNYETFVSPPTSSALFEFWVKIHNHKQSSIGVMDMIHSYGKDKFIGNKVSKEEDGFGRAWFCISSNSCLDGSDSGHFQGTAPLKPFQTGDVIRFLVDKENKKISIASSVDSEFVDCWTDLKYIPKQLRIAICLYNGEMELVRFLDYSRKAIDTDLPDRIEYLLEEEEEEEEGNKQKKNIVEKISIQFSSSTSKLENIGKFLMLY